MKGKLEEIRTGEVGEMRKMEVGKVSGKCGREGRKSEGKLNKRN